MDGDYKINYKTKSILLKKAGSNLPSPLPVFWVIPDWLTETEDPALMRIDLVKVPSAQALADIMGAGWTVEYAEHVLQTALNSGPTGMGLPHDELHPGWWKGQGKLEPLPAPGVLHTGYSGNLSTIMGNTYTIPINIEDVSPEVMNLLYGKGAVVPSKAPQEPPSLSEATKAILSPDRQILVQKVQEAFSTCICDDPSKKWKCPKHYYGAEVLSVAAVQAICEYLGVIP